ncbi:MAG: DUF3833 domain-containing protein [Chromatiales bacterium]|jgi:hypothetical protein
MTRRNWPAALVLLALLSGCSTMQPERFEGTKPRLALEEYFLGEVRAWGIFEDRFGNLRRQFTADIVGRMEGDELVLTEDFEYADGETQQRVWRIRRTGEHGYEGTAGDVEGTARGRAYGRALNWQYTLLLPIEGRTWRVHMNDWMFLQPDGALINRATMTKLGLRLGEVTVFFKREDPR